MSAKLLVAHPRIGQPALQQQRAADQRHQAAGAAGDHRQLLLHVDRQEGLIHPVRRQHAEEVAREDADNADVKQVGRQPHALLSSIWLEPARQLYCP